jgi:hypothetical protein
MATDVAEFDQANGDIPNLIHDRGLFGRIHWALGNEQAARRDFAVAYHLATANGLVKLAAEASANLGARLSET